MSKLFTLKKWVTLIEAANYLSVAFGELVSESDVIQLALDGHLKLSIRLLSDVYAHRWYKKLETEVEYEEVKYDSTDWRNGEKTFYTRMEPVGGRVIHLPEFCDTGEVLQLGTWAVSYARHFPEREVVDLPLTRCSRVFLLQCLDGLNDQPSTYDTGRLLIEEESGDLWDIESYEDDLLGDIDIVVKTKALRDLEDSLTPAADMRNETPLSSREKNTLLRIIAGITAANYKSYTGEKGTSTVSEILLDLQTVGIEEVKEDTLRKRLQEAAVHLPKKPEN